MPQLALVASLAYSVSSTRWYALREASEDTSIVLFACFQLPTVSYVDIVREG
jgi:hypothetical protein